MALVSRIYDMMGTSSTAQESSGKYLERWKSSTTQGQMKRANIIKQQAGIGAAARYLKECGWTLEAARIALID